MPRDEIAWEPAVDANACIGCGTGVTSCGRAGYRPQRRGLEVREDRLFAASVST